MQPDLFDGRIICASNPDNVGWVERTFIDARPVEFAPARNFIAEATDQVLAHLRAVGQASGEELTDACHLAGIFPPDDRAFGLVYRALARRGLIEQTGYCPRRKGHGTAGGIVWRLKPSHNPKENAA